MLGDALTTNEISHMKLKYVVVKRIFDACKREIFLSDHAPFHRDNDPKSRKKLRRSLKCVDALKFGTGVVCICVFNILKSNHFRIVPENNEENRFLNFNKFFQVFLNLLGPYSFKKCCSLIKICQTDFD